MEITCQNTRDQGPLIFERTAGTESLVEEALDFWGESLGPAWQLLRWRNKTWPSFSSGGIGIPPKISPKKHEEIAWEFKP